MSASNQLSFAFKYPFSRAAKTLLREKSFSLDDIPETVFKRAALMISFSVKKRRLPDVLVESQSVQEIEIIAFPVAKIILSMLDNQVYYERFAKAIAQRAYSFLGKENDRTEALLDLATELNVKYYLSENENEFVSVPLNSYLKIKFTEKYMKLVNQKVENSMVFLDVNLFQRFLHELIFSAIMDSLPVNLSSVPDSFRRVADQIKTQLVVRQKKEFEKIMGKVSIPSFPPCYEDMYSSLVQGKNLSHFARFDIATFLLNIGMPAKQVVDLFAKTPNFDERTSSYQVRMIAQKKMICPGCEKIRSHALCPDPMVCRDWRISHPLQYYKRLMRKTSPKADKKPKEKSA